jgi:tRNA A-37 threonylcarbamoyl transferase component Bud32
VSAFDARFCAGCGHRFLGEEGEAEVALAIADPLVGRVIAERYRIDQMIGRGGMGVVYRVEHVRIGKLMAMKLLHGELARDKEVLKRFRREAEAVSKLDHPATVQVFDFGRSEGLMYLVMELLGGRDLGAVIDAEGALPFARVARIGAQIAGSVAQAHARGVVHRDLKPENVRVISDRGENDVVKVMDFGLAKLRDTEEAAGASITRAGLIVGTPYYMAPEHIRGEATDPRSDIYALGALMYKCLTGVPPFYAPSPVGVLTKHLTDPVVPPSTKSARHGVPLDADRIVLRAMAKDPAERYQSMGELRAELLEWLSAVGEDPGVAERADRETLAAPIPFEHTDSGRRVEVATRGDVDRYERVLRAQSWVTNLVGVVLAGGLIAAGIYTAREWRPEVASTEVATEEVEPNDLPSDANELPEGVERQGYLGRRADPAHGDVDVWMVRHPGRQPRAISIELGALPNIDTVLEVFSGGRSEPLLRVDGAGRGEEERVPNLALIDPTYLLRVREAPRPGEMPTENVSDRYRLVWRYVDPVQGDEREVNDSFALAEPIGVSEPRQGFVGWRGDVDVFCIDRDVARADVVLEPVATLDLVMRIDERHLGRERTIDAGEIGEEERAAIDDARAGSTCIAIRAAEVAGGAASDAAERYSLRVVERGSSAP